MATSLTSEKTKGRVLVTGAGGFIGGATVRALADAGFQVRAGIRRPVADADAATVACDLDDGRQIREALRGVDVVVHAAYGDPARLEHQCSDLLAAMREAGVGRLVFLSSIAVYGQAEGAVDEATPAVGALDAYALGKRHCEALIEAETKSGLRAVILRPGIVYGAGSALWVDKMIARIRARAIGHFGDAGEGTAALIHVDDLAAMIVAGCYGLLSGRGDYWPAIAIANAVGPETPSWNGYFAALAARLGPEPLPDRSGLNGRLRQVLGAGAKFWRKFGLPGLSGLALTPMPGEMAIFGRRARYATKRATELFGPVASTSLQEGLDRCFRKTAGDGRSGPAA